MTQLAFLTLVPKYFDRHFKLAARKSKSHKHSGINGKFSAKK